MIVILIGYMASGKSSLGRLLAKKLNSDFIDLDKFIESKEDMTVKKIFENKGEIYFRKIESLYLNEIISQEKDLVLSLGGGTPCYSNNMEAILNAGNVKSIYLKASIPTLVKRLKKKKEKRPLVAYIENDEQLTEFIGKHLFERAPFYDQAHLKISTDNKSRKVIIEELYNALV